VTTEKAIIHADEATYYPETKSADLRGNVTIQLLTSPAISR
jgi:hypothetical protein